MNLLVLRRCGELAARALRAVQEPMKTEDPTDDQQRHGDGSERSIERQVQHAGSSASLTVR